MAAGTLPFCLHWRIDDAPQALHGNLLGNAGERNPKSATQPLKLKRLITSRQISKRLNWMAHKIARTVPLEERPIAIIVLQGAFIFGADLLRRFPARYSIDVAFLRCQSYGSEMQSSGHVLLLQDLDPSIDLRGRTVLLVDDILDSGLTIRFLLQHLRRRRAKRIRLCVLLKRNQRKQKRPDQAASVSGGINVSLKFFATRPEIGMANEILGRNSFKN